MDIQTEARRTHERQLAALGVSLEGDTLTVQPRARPSTSAAADAQPLASFNFEQARRLLLLGDQAPRDPDVDAALRNNQQQLQEFEHKLKQVCHHRIYTNATGLALCHFFEEKKT